MDPYFVRNSRGESIATLETGTVNTTATSLVLHGRGVSEYGLARDQNLVYLLEHFSNSTPPLNPIEGQLWWKTGDQFYVWSIIGSPTVGDWHTVIPPAADVGFIVEAGDGLIGGGFPTNSPTSTTLNVGGGTGITVSANSISTNDSEIVHDDLSGVNANEHIDHSLVNLTAGNGLVGGGFITGSVTFDIVAGDGIIVNANDVEVFTGSPAGAVTLASIQNIGGTKTFNSQVRFDTANTPATPALAFANEPSLGLYRVGSNHLGFASGGVARINIESNGVMNVGSTATYETLVIDDDDIPNKQYVDDLVGTGGVPTSNTFVGTSSLTGLDGTQTYLVSVYGIVPDKGGSGIIDGVEIRSGSTLGAGSVLAVTAARSVNWPDGEFPTFVNFVVSLSGNTAIHCKINDSSTGGATRYSTYMHAVQLTN